MGETLTYAKVDRNQGEIVVALRKMDAFVQSLASIGKGCPDLLVGHKGIWYLFEVKDEKKTPSARKLTSDEQDWHKKASEKAPVHVVESVEQAMKIIMVEVK